MKKAEKTKTKKLEMKPKVVKERKTEERKTGRVLVKIEKPFVPPAAAPPSPGQIEPVQPAIEEWVEIKPYATQELEPMNLAPFMNYVYGTGEPFEFLIMNAPSPRVEGRRSVRYFVRCPSPDHARVTSDMLQGLGFFTCRETPPPIEGDIEAELQFASHFAASALPVDPFASRSGRGETPPSAAEILVGALTSGGALKIAVKSDPKARFEVYKWAQKRAGGTGGLMKGGQDAVFGVLQEAAVQRDIKDVRQAEFWTKRQRGREDENAKRRTDMASQRMGQNLLACDARAYGTPQQVDSITSAIPFPSNSLRVFRTRPISLSKPLKPSRSWLLNSLRKLALGGVAGSLALAWWARIFNPLRLGTVDIALISLALAAGIGILVFWRIKRSVVLSTRELATLFSLPVNVGRLPLEHAPPTTPRKPLLPLSSSSREGEKLISQNGEGKSGGDARD